VQLARRDRGFDSRYGGGAVPYHWGRFRGLAQEPKKPLLDEHLLNKTPTSTPASITSRPSTCWPR